MLDTQKSSQLFFLLNNRSPLVSEKSHIKEKNSTTRVVRIKILPTIFNNFPLQKYQGINLILQLPFYGFFCAIHFLPEIYKSYLCSFKLEFRIYATISSPKGFGWIKIYFYYMIFIVKHVSKHFYRFTHVYSIK